MPLHPASIGILALSSAFTPPLPSGDRMQASYWVSSVNRSMDGSRLRTDNAPTSTAQRRSRFLQVGALDRLHLCVAPLLIGTGTRGLDPATIDHLEKTCHPVSIHRLGRDVLYDFAFTSPRSGAPA